MILGKSALFMLWNGTTCCVASHKARLNLNLRPYFVKCYRITEIFMSRIGAVRLSIMQFV
jgi:hypothetical protein